MQLPVLMSMAAQDRNDVAVRGGDRDQSERRVEDLEVFARGTGLAWVHAAAAFGRALAREHDDEGDASRVGELFESSLAHHAAANRP